MLIAEFQLVKAHTMGASFQSVGQTLEHYLLYAIQIVYTGSPVGTLTLSASNDNATWTTIAGTSQAVSGAGNTMYNVTDAGYRWVRVEYAFTSGSGVMNAYYVGKGF